MSNASPLDYDGRCARYLSARGIRYEPESEPGQLSLVRLTARQRRRALKKEHQAWRRRAAGEAVPRRG